MSTFAFPYAVTVAYSTTREASIIALFQRVDQAWDFIMGLRAHDEKRGYKILSKDAAFLECGINKEEEALDWCGYAVRLPDGVTAAYVLHGDPN